MLPHQYTLLTGSTGLLGQHFCSDLLRVGLPVAVLVRGDRLNSASTRLESIASRAEELSGRSLTRPVLLEGDLRSQNLGLSARDWRWAKRFCKSVIHSAASLSFKPASDHPDNEPFRTNVDGTLNLIEFSQTADISEFHYVSSAYVSGLRSGCVLEREGNLGQKFSNDYENSKLQAEQLIRQAGFESLTVYRPSIVVDDTTGAPNIGDRTIYYAKTVLGLMRQRFGELDPTALLGDIGLVGNEIKNIVSADWVSRMLVEIFRRPKFHGRTYHLTHPQGTKMSELIQALLDYNEKTMLKAKPRPATGWGDLEETVEQLVQTFQPYFRNDPVFDQTNLEEFLIESGLENCPVISRKTLQSAGNQGTPIRRVNDRGDSSDDSWVEMQKTFDQSIEANLAQTCPAITGLVDPDFGDCNQICLQLSLTGSGGGEWGLTLTRNPNHTSGSQDWSGGNLSAERGTFQSPDFRLVARANDWQDLLAGRIDLQELIDQGATLLEFHQPRFEFNKLQFVVQVLQNVILNPKPQESTQTQEGA